MLYWILVICILLFIVSCILAYQLDSEGFIVLAVILGIAIVVIVCFIFSYNVAVKGAEIIENKIEMYEEENAKIESEIAALVTAYMDYEKDTLESLKLEGSLVALVNMYPELKSDDLVQAQIELYISNQNKIIELKEDLIDLGKKRIWLGIREEE